MDSLIIEPGAEIFIEDDVDIRVFGFISIEGTKEDPVIMKGVNPEVGWGQLIIEHDVDSLKVEHVSIENGRFLIFNCHVRLTNVLFRNEQDLVWNDAIGRFYEGSLKIDSCQIIGSNKGEGFLCHNIDNPVLTNNYFERIPDAVELLNCTDGRVGKSVFFDNYDDAIDLNHCLNTVVDSNRIYDVWDRGMEIGSESNGSSTGIWVYRNLIVGCGKGINFKEGSTGLVENNTLHENGIGISALVSGTPSTGSSVEVVNCIFSGNEIPVFTEGSSIIDVSYSSSTEVLFPGEGNFVSDPQFVSSGTDDFNLRLYSPCLDRGSMSSPSDPDGTRRDLGAFYQPENVNSNEYQGKVKIWPNPTHELISIHMLDEFEYFEVYDYQGRKLMKVELNGLSYLEKSMGELKEWNLFAAILK